MYTLLLFILAVLVKIQATLDNSDPADYVPLFALGALVCGIIDICRLIAWADKEER